MESVYLETTFISYLVALPARDLVVAAHQQLTRDWWQLRRQDFRCVISPVVVREISAGDRSEIEKRLDVVRDLDRVEITADSEALTEAIMKTGVLPSKAIWDAAHIAAAAVHEVDYLLTWNCKHLANAQISRRIQKVCGLHGFEMPLICTPAELLEETGNA